MSSEMVITLFWTSLALLVVVAVLSWFAVHYRGHKDMWAIRGYAVSLLSLIATVFFGVSSLVVAIMGSTASSAAPSTSPTAAGKPPADLGPAAPVAADQPFPGAITLASDSPMRGKGLTMERVCRVIGQTVGKYAWLPGQVSDSSLEGRITNQHYAAGTWSCTRDGPRLTRAQLTHGCQDRYGATSVAYTFDPDDAYSWVCGGVDGDPATA